MSVRRNKALALAVAVLIGAVPAFAIFGIEDTVELGPISYAQMIAQYGQLTSIASSQASTLTKMIEEVQTATKIYNNAMQTYNLASQMTQQLQNKNFTGAFGAAMANIPMDQGGETAQWARAVNMGVGAVESWNGSAISLQRNPLVVPGSYLAPHFASAEIGSGAGMGALQTIGNARMAQQQMQPAIANCENNALSSLLRDNTSMAQANNTNGCLSLLLRQSQSQIALDTARLDVQVAQAKLANDSLTENLNNVNLAQQTFTADQAGELGGDLASNVSHVDR